MKKPKVKVCCAKDCGCEVGISMRFKGEDWWYFVYCQKCGMESHWRSTEAEAWRAWDKGLVGIRK